LITGGDSGIGRAVAVLFAREIAPAYVFLASNADSSYMTGEVLTLLGGETRAA
jgi:NAD(P)-dependent dehydrogenase (short-subunit alcohol dehydrogenase family)